MSQGEGIGHELGLGEVITKTFELYRRNFVSYFILFLVVEAIFGILTAVVQRAANLPALGSNPTSQQVMDWLSGSLGTLIFSGLLLFVVAIIVFPVAYGAAIRMASEEIQGRKTDIMASASFAAGKLLSIWAASIIVGIIVFLGLIALIIPGIILAIMFLLVLPVILIENVGVITSLSRSRELVSRRWLLTFATFLVLGIVVLIISAVLGLLSAPFGSASGFVGTLLGAFTAPIFPIAFTVYYYSNLARFSQGQGTHMGGAAAPMPMTGMKFCPNCGTQLEAAATFCSKCGAKQPA